MNLENRLRELAVDNPLTGDFYYQRTQGISQEITTELLNLLRDYPRIYGVRAILRRINLPENIERMIVILTNSPNLFTQRLPSNVIFIITSINPLSLSLSIGREELVSTVSWIL